MDSKTVTALVRHILTFGGGVLVALGWLDEGTVQTLVGAGTTIVGVVWSIFDKKINQAETPTR